MCAFPELAEGGTPILNAAFRKMKAPRAVLNIGFVFLLGWGCAVPCLCLFWSWSYRCLWDTWLAAWVLEFKLWSSWVWRKWLVMEPSLHPKDIPHGDFWNPELQALALWSAWYRVSFALKSLGKHLYSFSCHWDRNNVREGGSVFVSWSWRPHGPMTPYTWAEHGSRVTWQRRAVH